MLPPDVILMNPLQAGNEAHKQGSTLVLKPRVDITRNPNPLAPRKGLVSSNFVLKKGPPSFFCFLFKKGIVALSSLMSSGRTLDYSF